MFTSCMQCTCRRRSWAPAHRRPGAAARNPLLSDYARLRVDLTCERTRYWQRLEKLLEDAPIKISSVASTMTTLSTRDMLEALIAGQRDPRVLAVMLLDQIDAPTTQIDKLTTWIDESIAALPPAPAVAEPEGPSGPGHNCVTARPARAPRTSRACSAKPQPQRPRPTPPSARSTDGSSNAADNSKPWSRSPAPSASGTYPVEWTQGLAAPWPRGARSACGTDGQKSAMASGERR